MQVCITIPAFNEGHRLRDSVTQLHHFLQEGAQWDWEIVIAQNGSSDATPAIAETLAKEYSKIRVNQFKDRGRGGALKQTWLESKADILCYMDADLSTDLKALPALIESLTEKGYDLAIGSRLLHPTWTNRCLRREVTSRCYNLLVKAMLGINFSDAQCGFKAISHRAAKHLLPLVEDTGWFFDTELLTLAERHGYRIADLPVKWTEGHTSRVRIFSTAKADMAGLWRLRRKFQQHRMNGS